MSQGFRRLDWLMGQLRRLLLERGLLQLTVGGRLGHCPGPTHPRSCRLHLKLPIVAMRVAFRFRDAWR